MTARSNRSPNMGYGPAHCRFRASRSGDNTRHAAGGAGAEGQWADSLCNPPRWAMTQCRRGQRRNSPTAMDARDAAGARGLTAGSTTICSITSSMITRRAPTESGSTLARCAQDHPTTQPAVPRGWMCPVVFRTIQTLTQHLLAAPLYRTGRLILVPFQRALCNHRRKPAGLRSANPRPSLPHRYCLPCCRIANLVSMPV